MASWPTYADRLTMPGSFITVACPECGNEQTVFEKSATTVSCSECDATLLEPTGGKAGVAGEVVSVVEDRPEAGTLQ